ncbi:hypothetical protein KC354_g19 [Hortaea werneckii]|nr:hypothetical protein KC354_g19 [Hortaea werneckii]
MATSGFWGAAWGCTIGGGGAGKGRLRNPARVEFSQKAVQGCWMRWTAKDMGGYMKVTSCVSLGLIGYSRIVT